MTTFDRVFARTSKPYPKNGVKFRLMADATNLGRTRMAAASQGVTRDQLIWIADAYIRPETYKAALARIINAHHALPIATLWGDGPLPRPTASSSAPPSAAMPPARSTPVMGTTPASVSIPIFPISTAPTASR